MILLNFFVRKVEKISPFHSSSWNLACAVSWGVVISAYWQTELAHVIQIPALLSASALCAVHDGCSSWLYVSRLSAPFARCIWLHRPVAQSYSSMFAQKATSKPDANTLLTMLSPRHLCSWYHCSCLMPSNKKAQKNRNLEELTVTSCAALNRLLQSATHTHNADACRVPWLEFSMQGRWPETRACGLGSASCS